MGRSRRSKSRLKKSVLLIAAALIGLVWPWLRDAYRFAFERHIFHALAAAAALLFVRRVVLTLRHWRRIRSLAFSDRARHYVIERADYRRGTAKEAAYRRTMQLTLLAKFDNACAKCGAQDDGVDLDHFFLPKSEGGSFVMRHADGYFVNNAVPLCVRCNRSKSDRSWRSFFSEEQLPLILEKNADLTRRLNERPVLDQDGRPHPRVKSRAS